jgi:hypothetical protein
LPQRQLELRRIALIFESAQQSLFGVIPRAAAGLARKARFMIAYFILVHRFPEQFKRMFKAIYEPGNHYVIHVDKRSGNALARELGEFIKPYPSAAMLTSQNAMWGGYSLVNAELRGMTKLLEMNADWRYYINLSGQDFPLKSQQYMRDYLTEHQGQEFIRTLDQQAVRPDTMNRISHVFVEAFNRMFRTGLKRAYLDSATPYIGTQWKAVSREFCRFVTQDPIVDRFKKFYRFSFIADESFFQTVIMNVGQHAKRVVNDDLRTIDWIPDGSIKLRPRTFGAADLTRLANSADLFARKFNQEEDSEILGLLETHLKSDLARVFVAPVLKRARAAAAIPAQLVSA